MGMPATALRYPPIAYPAMPSQAAWLPTPAQLPPPPPPPPAPPAPVPNGPSPGPADPGRYRRLMDDHPRYKGFAQQHPILNRLGLAASAVLLLVALPLATSSVVRGALWQVAHGAMHLLNRQTEGKLEAFYKRLQPKTWPGVLAWAGGFGVASTGLGMATQRFFRQRPKTERSRPVTPLAPPSGTQTPDKPKPPLVPSPQATPPKEAPTGPALPPPTLPMGVAPSGAGSPWPSSAMSHPTVVSPVLQVAPTGSVAPRTAPAM